MITIQAYIIKQIQQIMQQCLQLKNKCISQYKAAISKLYQNKKFISFKLIYNSHQIAMEVALQSIHKSGCADENSLKKQVADLINQQLNKVIEDVSELNLKWSKNYLESQFTHIQNKIKSKQLNSFKQQLNSFIDTFHRKVQLIHCKKIQLFFEHFLVQKIIDNCLASFEYDKKQLIKQISQLQNQLSSLQLSDKQYKKQKNKQLSITSTHIEQLQQKINYSRTRQQLLETTLHQLKQQKLQMDLEYDRKVQQMEQSFLIELKELQIAKSAVVQETAALKMKIVLLEGEVQKEKQMHQQTHHQYKLMINEFRAKEMHLQNQISQITIKSNQQLNESRKYLERQQHQNSLSKTQKEHEALKLSQNIANLTTKYSQLQKSFINLQHQSDKRQSELQVQRNDLSHELKVCKQQLSAHQKQCQQNTSLIDTLILQNKQKQQQLIALKQQNKQHSQKIKQLDTKYQNEKNNNSSLKNNINQLNNRINKSQKNKNNSYAQTQNNCNFKKQLQDALKMTINIENQYKKIKHQSSKLKPQLQ